MKRYENTVQFYYVYKHTSPSGKIYIGITKQKPQRRWNCGKSYQHNKFFSNAIQKYGWENFTHEILFSGLTKEEAERKEVELIDLYKSNQREYGYNILDGGDVSSSSYERTEAHRKAISDRMKGRIVSEEERQRLRMLNTGIHHTLETRQKMSESRKGKKHSLSHIQHLATSLKGKKRSEEVRAKMSLSSTCKKAVVQYDKELNFVARYNSIAEAKERTGIDASNIGHCCKGKARTAGGYCWEYAKVGG